MEVSKGSVDDRRFQMDLKGFQRGSEGSQRVLKVSKRVLKVPKRVFQHFQKVRRVLIFQRIFTGIVDLLVGKQFEKFKKKSVIQY